MNDTCIPKAPTRLTLWAQNAGDLMTPNPVSLPADAPFEEALTLLTTRGFTAAPVITEAGRPIGVVSQTDLLARSRADHQPGTSPGTVRELMTPVVFGVSPDTPAYKVVEEMLALKVHRLFVVDDDGVLIGVISPNDVLRRLRP